MSFKEFMGLKNDEEVELFLTIFTLSLFVGFYFFNVFVIKSETIEMFYVIFALIFVFIITPFIIFLKYD